MQVGRGRVRQRALWAPRVVARGNPLFLGAGGERCVSRPHIGPICHCCVLDPALHFLARIFAPFLWPDEVTQSPSPFWIVISLPPSLHGPSELRSSAGEPLLH